jgi:hypothetical protein
MMAEFFQSEMVPAREGSGKLFEDRLDASSQPVSAKSLRQTKIAATLLSTPRSTSRSQLRLSSFDPSH